MIDTPLDFVLRVKAEDFKIRCPHSGGSVHGRKHPIISHVTLTDVCGEVQPWYVCHFCHFIWAGEKLEKPASGDYIKLYDINHSFDPLREVPYR
jgi:hypothetical protein